MDSTSGGGTEVLATPLVDGALVGPPTGICTTDTARNSCVLSQAVCADGNARCKPLHTLRDESQQGLFYVGQSLVSCFRDLLLKTLDVAVGCICHSCRIARSRDQILHSSNPKPSWIQSTGQVRRHVRPHETGDKAFPPIQSVFGGIYLLLREEISGPSISADDRILVCESPCIACVLLHWTDAWGNTGSGTGRSASLQASVAAMPHSMQRQSRRHNHIRLVAASAILHDTTSQCTLREG